MIEPADINRSVRTYCIIHGDPGVLKRMIHIFQHQPLLRIERQKLVLGDVEERPIEIGGVFGEKMSSLYMELNNVQHFDPTTL